MSVSITIALFVIALVVSLFMFERYVSADEEGKTKIKNVLSKLYMLAACAVSCIVGLLFVRFEPDVFYLFQVKPSAATATVTTEALIAGKTFGLFFGGSTFSVIFEILFANVIMMLCFIALPMMVGIGLVLLFPTFVATGKASAEENHFRKPSALSANTVRRTFLVFSDLRN